MFGRAAVLGSRLGPLLLEVLITLVQSTQLGEREEEERVKTQPVLILAAVPPSP